MARTAAEARPRAAPALPSTRSASPLTQALADIRKQDRSTPRALISTIMGDMILPHGGTIGLSSLVRMGTAFGLDERLTRTTAVRLVYDGWFTTQRVGRQSYYTITGEPLERLSRYAPRIYEAYAGRWSGEWRMILLNGKMSTKKQAALKSDLQWEGAGQLAPSIFVYASDDIETLHRVLSDHGVLGETLILTSPVRGVPNAPLVAKTASQIWRLEAIEDDYKLFLDRFSPLLRLVQPAPIEPEEAFILRTLLMLQYRKLVLKDPQLPIELLPSPWAGHAAVTLCRNLYYLILEPSEAFLREVGRTQFGAFGPASPTLRQRFGGPL